MTCNILSAIKAVAKFSQLFVVKCLLSVSVGMFHNFIYSVVMTMINEHYVIDSEHVTSSLFVCKCENRER
jgi:hypothetical protein